MATKKKWMQSAVKKPGALHRQLGKKQGEKLTLSEINAKIAQLKKKRQQRGKLTQSELLLMRRLVFAKNAMKASKGRKRKK